MRVYDILPTSFYYEYIRLHPGTRFTYGGYSVSSNGEPIQYEKFMLPVESLTRLERVIYGIKD